MTEEIPPDLMPDGWSDEGKDKEVTSLYMRGRIEACIVWRARDAAYGTGMRSGIVEAFLPEEITDLEQAKRYVETLWRMSQ